MSISIVIPKNIDSIDSIEVEKRVIEPFSEILVEFVNDVSKAILKDSFFKTHPELMALAFWMRKSHIKELQRYFFRLKSDRILVGRGVVFHIAPSNVDTIFVYSWFISLLVGNSNILRISNKENIQTELLLNVIRDVLYTSKYSTLQNRIAIIRYGHIDDITKKLSYMADVRVIWGGDSTVKHIRTIPIKPTAIELTFADKFSFAVINVEKFLQKHDSQAIIEKFYNDSFWFGQMACSSIRLVAWVGNNPENIKSAQNKFWKNLSKYVLEKKPEEIAPADIVNKLVAECSMAIEKQVKIDANKNPYINKVKISSLEEVDESLHCGTGLFYELEVENLGKLMPFMTKKYQTVAQYGFSKEELSTLLYQNLPEGIDRVVPIGQSLDFSHIWDGYDLFRSFCREIEIL